MASLTDLLTRKDYLRKIKSESIQAAVLSQESFLMANAQTLQRVSVKNAKVPLSSQALEIQFTEVP